MPRRFLKMPSRIPDKHCRYQTILGLGLFSIIMGGACMVCGVLLVVNKSWMMEYYHGVIAGGWLFLCGLIGTIGGCTKSKIAIVLFMLFSFITATGVAVGLFIISWLGYNVDNAYSLAEFVNEMNDQGRLNCAKAAVGSALNEDKLGYFKCPNEIASMMNLILMGLGAGLAIVGTLSVILSCCSVCCSRSDDEVYPVQVKPYPNIQPAPIVPVQRPVPPSRPPPTMPTVVPMVPMAPPPPPPQQIPPMGDYRPLKGHYGFTPQQIGKARSLFDGLDKNRDGNVSMVELGSLVRAFGFEATEDELRQLHKEIDKNQDGLIEFEELMIWLASSREATFTPEDIDLINLMRQKYYPLQKEMIFEILKTFKKYDTSGDYLLSIDEMKRAMDGMGTFLHPTHMQHLHQSVDQNGDGMVDFEEFLRHTLRTSKL